MIHFLLRVVVKKVWKPWSMKINLIACNEWCWDHFFSWALMAVTELKNVNLETYFSLLRETGWQSRRCTDWEWGDQDSNLRGWPWAVHSTVCSSILCLFKWWNQSFWGWYVFFKPVTIIKSYSFTLPSKTLIYNLWQLKDQSY